MELAKTVNKLEKCIENKNKQLLNFRQAEINMKKEIFGIKKEKSAKRNIDTLSPNIRINIQQVLDPEINKNKIIDSSHNSNLLDVNVKKE